MGATGMLKGCVDLLHLAPDRPETSGNNQERGVEGRVKGCEGSGRRSGSESWVYRDNDDEA